MIPIKYNVRNLRERHVSTMMIVLATALMVASSCFLFGLVEGLQHSLKVSGEPLDLIVLRKGSTNETNGGYETQKADDVLNLPGIARDENGMMLAAKEMVNIPIAERTDGSHANIIVRGVSPASPQLRPEFKVVSGRYLERGKGEAVVSRSLARRFKGGSIGGTLKVGEKESYRVVGLFTAGGSAAESEVWVDLTDLERAMGREGYVSSVQVRAKTAQDFDTLRKTIDNDTQFKLSAQPETRYFSDQAQSSLFLTGAGTLIAVLLTIGAMFASANTMYAAVSTRTREIGTLRALGFPRRDILISFLTESVLLCTAGGILGLLATLPFSAFTYGTSNFNNFAEMTVAFRFGPRVMLVACLMTAAMGIFGGLMPAVRAVRLDVVRALREV